MGCIVVRQPSMAGRPVIAVISWLSAVVRSFWKVSTWNEVLKAMIAVDEAL